MFIKADELRPDWTEELSLQCTLTNSNSDNEWTQVNGRISKFIHLFYYQNMLLDTYKESPS